MFDIKSIRGGEQTDLRHLKTKASFASLTHGERECSCQDRDKVESN